MERKGKHEALASGNPVREGSIFLCEETSTTPGLFRGRFLAPLIDIFIY